MPRISRDRRCSSGRKVPTAAGSVVVVGALTRSALFTLCGIGKPCQRCSWIARGTMLKNKPHLVTFYEIHMVNQSKYIYIYIYIWLVQPYNSTNSCILNTIMTTTNKDERHSLLEKYTSHFIERVVCERELKTEQNCNILNPTLLTIIAFLPRSPGLLNRGPGGPASLGHVLIPASSFQLVWSPTD